jgi:hypothetical protein
MEISLLLFGRGGGEIVRVFIQVKVWLKRSLGQSEGGTGRGRVQVEEQAVINTIARCKIYTVCGYTDWSLNF